MNKIDTSSWRTFAIKDIFDVKRPPARSQSDYNKGIVPFVASGNSNNGVLKFLSPKENETLDKGNCITVSPIDGSSFYQQEDFLGRGGAGSSIVLLYNDNLSLYSGYFIATVIRTACQKYAYSDMGNKGTIGNEEIQLPVDKDGNPDFVFMEKYMKKVHDLAYSSLKKLQTEDMLPKTNLANNTWEKFAIGDLFKIVKGTRLTKADMKEGTIRFIGASAINNGITAFISNNEKLHPKNTITISYNGSVGEAFYQDEQFWASDDVNVLYPKFNMNFYIAMFLIPTLKAAGRKYAFIDKWKKEDMEKDCIMLPVDNDGNPDWIYMENYIKISESKIRKSLTALQATL